MAKKGPIDEYQPSKYICKDYKGTNYEEQQFPGGQTSITYPINCYSHKPITNIEQQNKPKKDDKLSTELDIDEYKDKFTKCAGYRNRNQNQNELVLLSAKAEIGQLSEAAQINNVRNAIDKEINRRRLHAAYQSIENAENPVSAGNMEYKKYIEALQNEIVAADIESELDNEVNKYPDKSIDFTSPFVSASHLNTLKEMTIQVMEDCICYSDCNEYAVCWCHGYCYYY